MHLVSINLSFPWQCYSLESSARSVWPVITFLLHRSSSTCTLQQLSLPLSLSLSLTVTLCLILLTYYVYLIGLPPNTQLQQDQIRGWELHL